MGYYEKDVYYNPEDFGLEIVVTIEREDLSYEFDMFVVWKDTNGALYYATDSGCSCPSPFENHTSIADLTYATKAEIIAALDEWGSASDVERADLIDALQRA
jgi:hypothetical protein